MKYQSVDGAVEVSVSDQLDANGYFSVHANRVSPKDLRAYIEVQFGSKDNSTRIDYRSQDQVKEWTVRGSHRGDVVTAVNIVVIA